MEDTSKKKKGYSFALEPGQVTRRTKHTECHWVTYRQDGEIEREVWEDGAEHPKLVTETVKAGERIWREAGTEHAVKNKGRQPLVADKDFGTEAPGPAEPEAGQKQPEPEMKKPKPDPTGGGGGQKGS